MVLVAEREPKGKTHRQAMQFFMGLAVAEVTMEAIILPALGIKVLCICASPHKEGYESSNH